MARCGPFWLSLGSSVVWESCDVDSTLHACLFFLLLCTAEQVETVASGTAASNIALLVFSACMVAWAASSRKAAPEAPVN